MPGVEYTDIPSVVGDRWGRKRATRVFRLWGIDPKSITEDPASVSITTGFLPDYNSAWQIAGEEYPMRLDSYIVRKEGTLVEAIAVYTNDLTLAEVSVENKTQTYEIPFATKMENVLLGQNNRRITAWKENSFKIEAPAVRFNLTVRIDRDIYLASAPFIASQKGKIQRIKIGGTPGSSTPGGTDVYGLFDVGDAVPYTQSTMQVRYSWTVDYGNAVVARPQTDTDEFQFAWPPQNKLSGLTGTGYDGEYVRPPFAVLKMAPRARQPDSFDQPSPTFFVVRPHPVDEGGAASLPGYSDSVFLPVYLPGGGG